MRITNVSVWAVKLRLSEPYAVTYENVEHAVNVFLRLETNRGLIGLGCANPDEAVCGETEAGVSAALTGPARDALLAADPLRAAQLREQLRKLLPHSPAARAAVDMALFDLLGKYCNVPVYQLLGGYRDRIITSVTIGILDIDETVRRARDLTAQGFKALKVKGGLDVEQDIERVLAVRNNVGPDVELRFDANQGYDVTQALRLVKGSRRARLELLEQPTHRDELDALGAVTRATALPIMADESLMGMRDAFRIARGGLADMINVKLMKCGGIWPAMEITSLARTAGLEVMIGCMDESALGIAAALNVALAHPGVVYADLDGHLDLLDDPTAAAVKLEDGMLTPRTLDDLDCG